MTLISLRSYIGGLRYQYANSTPTMAADPKGLIMVDFKNICDKYGATCGRITVEIVGPGRNGNVTDVYAPDLPQKGEELDIGAIIFQYWTTGVGADKNCCSCTQFAWIQHVSGKGANAWRYDNGVAGPGGMGGPPQGFPSNPSAPQQPTGGNKPWYGGQWGAAGMGGGFNTNPTPQPRIGDKPTVPAGLDFVTQLVCVDDGTVYYNWTWSSNANGPAGAPQFGARDPRYGNASLC